MHIVLCGSIAHYDRMCELQVDLEQKGHSVTIPPKQITDEHGKMMDVKEYHELRRVSMGDEDSWIWKRKNQLMADYFHEVKRADAILVVNEEKNDIQNYIGANTLLEMGIALHHNIPIYLLNPIPEISYKEEILACQPKILNGDLNAL